MEVVDGFLMDSGFEQLDNDPLSCRPMDLDSDVQPMDMGLLSPPHEGDDATVGLQKPDVEHGQPGSKVPPVRLFQDFGPALCTGFHKCL